MLVASASMVRYRNVLMAHSVMLDKISVHHALLALSATVGWKSRVLQELQALMDKRYVQLALKDLPALREPQFQLSVNLDSILE
jgi:hypothetical protein